MINVIVIIIIAAILGAAVRYIVKEKKRGAKCIGCSAAGSCTYANQSEEACGCSREGQMPADAGCGCESRTKPPCGECGEGSKGSEPPAR